jgi:hypothetical protein
MRLDQFQFPWPSTPRIARLLEWRAQVLAALEELTPAEQQAARELARTSVLSILQAITVIKSRRRP